MLKKTLALALTTACSFNALAAHAASDSDRGGSASSERSGAVYETIYNVHEAQDAQRKSVLKPEPVEPQALPVPESPHDWKSSYFPLFFYTPETSAALGLVTVHTQRDGDLDKTHRPDSMIASVFGTAKGQFGIRFDSDFYFARNDWRLKTPFMATYFPSRYYGVGPLTAEEAKETYTSKSLSLQPILYRKIISSLSLGLGLHYGVNRLSDFQEGGQLALQTVTGSSGGVSVGIIPALEWDSRDNSFFPRHGGWYQLRTGVYRAAWGGDYTYTRASLDMRRYFPVGANDVFAWQSMLAQSSPGVPFDALFPTMLRGINNERFRDRALVMSQAEYRTQLGERWVGAGFFGVGNVGDGLDRISAYNIKYAGGVGVRYLLNKDEKVTTRFDLGISPWGVMPYIVIREAF